MKSLSVIVFLTATSTLALAKPPQTIDGTCGPDQGVSTSTPPAQSGLCNSGTASAVSGGNGTTWTWTCNGSGPHHKNASCSAPFASSTVNGQCGSANGVPSCTAPTSGLCSSGTATAVSGPPWVWSCMGSGGGTTASCNAPAGTNCGGGTSGQLPGPSIDLFNNPYYRCTTNYYVSTAGNDTTGTGSQSAPWKTLQRADTAHVSPGSCINVAPGTYNGMLVNNGGNAATATGYVTYRCQAMDACVILGNGGYNGSSAFDFVRTTNGVPPNFIQIDGFEMVGQGTFYAVGVNIYNGDNSDKVASHHIWVLNSIIHGFGQAGIGFAASEYLYAIHNTAYKNSNTQCDAQGSGIAINIAHTVPGYTPTADDRTNPNPLLGPTWQVGGSFFRIVFEYNVTYNNALTQCGTASSPYDTDGNGIIFDTNAAPYNSTNYTGPMLAAFNVTYNNGGGGIHVFHSAHVTIANNSCYNNWLDPFNQGIGRGCIDSFNSWDNTYINNIAVAIVPNHGTCTFNQTPYAMWNSAFVLSPSGTPLDTSSNNITKMIGDGCMGEIAEWDNGFGTDPYTSPPNFLNTVPGWVDVGTSSTGTETTQPAGRNFALTPSSPAIGNGLTEPYLPAQSVDIGACASSFTICP